MLRKISFIAAILLIVISQIAIADVITDWNNISLNTIKSAGLTSVTASRTLAMVHAAVYDSVNSIDGGYQSYRTSISGYSGASKEAAAVSAAHRVLSGMFPSQSAALNSAYTASLSTIVDGSSKTSGIALGQTVADSMLAWRSTDHSSDMGMFMGGTNPGEWRPTPPNYAMAMMPQWPNVTPFVMTSGSQFRPGQPPALTGVEYAQALNEVKDIGMKNSLSRTAEQTTIAYFWADSPGTITTAGRWNVIAQQAATAKNNTLEENARLFAALNVTLADAGICAWDSKYHFSLWRPITAIREAGADGNPLTEANAMWMPELMTPAFQEYVSAHSAFSGAAAEMLKRYLGDDASITIASYSDPASYRNYTSFTQLADEAGISRIFGGIHYSFSNIEGLTAGRNVAGYTYDNYFQPVPEPSAMAGMAASLAGLLINLRARKKLN